MCSRTLTGLIGGEEKTTRCGLWQGRAIVKKPDAPQLTTQGDALRPTPSH